MRKIISKEFRITNFWWKEKNKIPLFLLYDIKFYLFN